MHQRVDYQARVDQCESGLRYVRTPDSVAEAAAGPGPGPGPGSGSGSSSSSRVWDVGLADFRCGVIEAHGVSGSDVGVHVISGIYPG